MEGAASHGSVVRHSRVDVDAAEDTADAVRSEQLPETVRSKPELWRAREERKAGVEQRKHAVQGAPLAQLLPGSSIGCG